MSSSKDVPTDPAEPPTRKRRFRQPLLRRTVTTAVENVDMDVTSDPNEPSQPPKPRFRLPTVGQISAIVGLIAGVLGLVFLVFPALRPEPPLDSGTVEVSDVRVRQPVSFGRYLQRLKLPPGELTAEFLARRGVMIEFQTKIEGFKGKQLPLRWELNDAATNDVVDEDQAVTIKPSTNNEGRTWFVWAPAPETTGKYYVTVTIYQPPKGEVDVPLEAFDSPEFTGLAAAP